LRVIETVTRDLTEMIQRIAVNTETQVVVAEEVRKIMRDVLQVTGSTTEGTQSATTSVTEIADQAMSLKSSVAQFKVA
jgi:methyl-accepting chemotaxis protein